MKLLTDIELEEAAEAGDGICLDCGHLQPFVEKAQARFGLCEECGMQRVLRAVDIWQGMWWIDTGDVG